VAANDAEVASTPGPAAPAVLNEPYRFAAFNLQMAKTHLQMSNPELTKRTWQQVMEAAVQTKHGPTKTRYERAIGPSLDHQLATLIGQMWSANPTWGSKRIQAELAKLSINASDSTIRKYRPKSRRTRSDETWKPSCVAMPRS
jgi:predicted oxidoreductase